MITNSKKINKTHVLLREILLEQSYNILLVQEKKKNENFCHFKKALIRLE